MLRSERSPPSASATQEELVVKAVGSGGMVLLLFAEAEAGRKGRMESQERLAGKVHVRLVNWPPHGLHLDPLTPEQLGSLLQ